jgi:hypothetical protein
MKVKIIPDIEGCRDLSELDDEGNMLVEQSTYDDMKAMVKAWIDEFHGKNVAFQKGAIALVFREDWTIEIMKADHVLAESEAKWAEYFIGECGFAESIRRG